VWEGWFAGRVPAYQCLTVDGLSRFQDEDFEEDEGIYDDLHLEEEEEAFATAQLIKEPSEDLDDILSVSEGELITRFSRAQSNTRLISPP
jgi:hypothetical protein